MSRLASRSENASIGLRLASVRMTAHLSQAAFAERLGLSLRAYANYERGERETPAALLTALHAVFGIDPLWVLTGLGGDSPRAAKTVSAALEQDLLQLYGPLVGGADLQRALGFDSMLALQKADSRGQLPVPVFPLKFRRGKYALAKDIAAWLAAVRAGAEAV